MILIYNIDYINNICIRNPYICKILYKNYNI